MASILKVDKLDPQSGTALEIGTSGDTVTVPSGVSLTLTSSTLSLPTTINTDKIDPKSAAALEIGTSGDTITVPSGATFVVAGTTEITGTNNVQRPPNSQQIIINSDMAVSQRATSVAGIGQGDGGYHALDRFKYQEGSTPDAVWTMSQETLTSGNAWTAGFTTALKMDCTTADPVLISDLTERIDTWLEKNDLNSWKKGTSNAEKITVAFWIKATKTGTQIVEFQDQTNDRTCSQAYTVDTTDTWEHKVVNFPADTTGAFGTGNATGLKLRFWLTAGTDYTSSSLQTTWGAASTPNRAEGQVNNADSTSNNWHLTGVQMEIGEFTSSTLPPFQFESYGDNLVRCQRYAYVISGDNQVLGFGFGKGSDNVVGPVIFPTTMRSAPTTTTTTLSTAFKFQGSKPDGTGQDQNVDGSANSSEQAGTRGVTYKMGGLSTVGGGSTGFFRTNSANAHLLFSSELQMNIETVKKTKDAITNEEFKILLVTDTNDQKHSVPMDDDNTDYQEIMKWVSEGNVIEEAD